MQTAACLMLRQDKPPVTARQNLLEDRNAKIKVRKKKIRCCRREVVVPPAAPKHP